MSHLSKGGVTEGLKHPSESSTKNDHNCLKKERDAVSIESSLYVLKKMEAKYLIYHPQMLYAQDYEGIYLLLSDFEQRFHTTQQTKLVALYFFCKYVESVPVDCRMYESYSLVCMMLAMKYEECYTSLPYIVDVLLAYPQFCTSVNEYNTLEKDVLRGYFFRPYDDPSLRWRLNCVTAAHFLYAICSHPVIEDFIYQNFRVVDSNHDPLDYLLSFCRFFLDLLSSKYEYRQFSSSVQACACFICSLHVFHIKSLWNETIERLFSVSYDNVKKCLSLLWNDYCNEFPDYVNPGDNEDFLH